MNKLFYALTFFALFAFSLLAPPSFAQDNARNQEARGLYEAGAVAFGDGRFEDALGRWEEAYALTELPALRYNIGTANDRLGQAREALSHYRAYLEAVPDAENRNYVVRRIEVLQVQVAESDAAAAAQAAAERRDQAATNLESETEVEIQEVQANPETSGSTESSGLSAPALVVTATGGALLVAGLATALVTNGRYSDLEDGCSMGICTTEQSGDIDGLRRMALTTDILLAVGGVATVAGVLWLIVGSGADDADESALRLDVGHDRVLVSGAF